MDDLMRRLQALETTKAIKPCRMQQLLDRLDDDTRSLLERLLADRRQSARQIHDVLQKSGCAVTRETISAHRKHECRCHVIGVFNESA